MLPRSLSFSSEGPTPLRLLPARGAGAGPTLRASHSSQLRVYRCSGSLASAPLPCRPGRTPRSVTKICSPVKLHSPSWLCGPDWPTKPAPHTPSCLPAQCGAHAPPALYASLLLTPQCIMIFLIQSAQGLYLNHTPQFSTVPKVLLPQERRAAVSLGRIQESPRAP